jgi:hypothetical protein
VIAALLLAAAPVAAAPAAIDAERAFAADAQKLGQWTAFRKYAADDAVMFMPQQVNAQAFLKPLMDPPVAVFWWPGKSFVSCDGTYAVNTGPWVRQWGKAVGYFTTVWQRQPDGSWKWIYDGGDSLEVPRAEGGDIKSRRASCGKPVRAPRPRLGLTQGGTTGAGQSADDTLVWRWFVRADGSRTLEVLLWNGSDWETVLDDNVGPAQ